jgi:hypothetical protein
VIAGPASATRAEAGPHRSERRHVDFPADFLWGSATSAHQVEGGNTNNDFTRVPKPSAYAFGRVARTGRLDALHDGVRPDPAWAQTPGGTRRRPTRK